MGFFDERVLTVLRDGKSRDFHHVLGKVGFSHNTLRLHLRRLVDQGLVVKKMRSKGLGRPRSTYSPPPRLKRKHFFTVSDPFTEVVHITFNRLAPLHVRKGRILQKD